MRDVTRLLADKFHKRVVVVDSSMEIGGHGRSPHVAIGKARRIPVPDRKKQHDLLVEAVQNHNPQVVVVDEIGTIQEVKAVASIAQRGNQSFRIFYCYFDSFLYVYICNTKFIF